MVKVCPDPAEVGCAFAGRVSLRQVMSLAKRCGLDISSAGMSLMLRGYKLDSRVEPLGTPDSTGTEIG